MREVEERNHVLCAHVICCVYLQPTHQSLRLDQFEKLIDIFSLPQHGPTKDGGKQGRVSFLPKVSRGREEAEGVLVHV